MKNLQWEYDGTVRWKISDEQNSIENYLVSVYIQIRQLKFLYFEIFEHGFFSENQKHLIPVKLEPSSSSQTLNPLHQRTSWYSMQMIFCTIQNNKKWLGRPSTKITFQWKFVQRRSFTGFYHLIPIPIGPSVFSMNFNVYMEFSSARQHNCYV